MVYNPMIDPVIIGVIGYPMTISVLLVDDHTLFRESVRALLTATTDFNVVGEAGDGIDALVIVEHLYPDVVVLDYMMPGMNGVDIMWWLHKQRPETHVVLLSMHNDDAYVAAAIKNGASAYILKEDVVKHLAQAVAAAAAGQRYFSPGLRAIAAQLEIENKDVKEQNGTDEV
jgi:DNA-binding NarL/FixJ family response regulator